jgi:probable HAF family extracellular repeat protein
MKITFSSLYRPALHLGRAAVVGARHAVWLAAIGCCLAGASLQAYGPSGAVVNGSLSPLPSNARAYGDAAVWTQNNTFLIVPQAASKTGSLIFDMPQSGQVAWTFTAEWYFKLSAGANGDGDGYSFCYGDLPSSTWGSAELGAGSGLRIQFLTYGADRVVVMNGNTEIGRLAMTLPANTWAKAQVMVLKRQNAYQLTVKWDNNVVVNGVTLSNWSPATSWRFGFGGRNGSAYQNDEINSVKIITANADGVQGYVKTDSKAVAGATVRSSSGITATTDSNGAYTLGGGMDPGTYTISVDDKSDYAFEVAKDAYVGSADVNFLAVSTPLPDVPIVTTGSVSGVKPTEAILTGTVQPQSENATYAFHYVSSSDNGFLTTETKVGQGLSFDGVKSIAKLPADFELITSSIGKDFSIEGWVYVQEHKTGGKLFHSGNTASTYVSSIYYNSVNLTLSDESSGNAQKPSLVIWDANDNSSRVISKVPIPLNRWIHLAATMQGTTGRLYMNGTEVGSNGNMIQAAYVKQNGCALGAAWQDGASPNNVRDAAHALFDEVRIWNAALSQQTIRDWRFKEATSSHPNYSGSTLRHYFKLNETSGTTLVDDGAAQANGTLANTTFSQSSAPLTLPVSTKVTGLIPGNTYTYHLNARSSSSSSGQTKQFTVPPTLDPLSDLTMDEDSTTQTVSLTGIGDGSADGTPTLSISATSSNTGLIPNPTVKYTSPNSTGILQFTPVLDQYGSADITVGVTYNSTTVNRTFHVTVNRINHPPMAGMATALRFNGVNSYVSVSGAGGLPITDEVTVEFWQKVKSVKKQFTFILNPDDYLANRFSAAVPYGDGKVYWDFGNLNGNAGRLVYTPPESITGTWQHFALVASKANNYMRIYRNGVLEAEKSGMSPFAGGNYNLILGGRSSSSEWFGGELAEFRIWNTERSEQDIRLYKDVPLAGNEDNLVVYYRLNENHGLAVHDNAAAAGTSDGKLYNNPIWEGSDMHGLLREVYTDISGSRIPGLTTRASYPDSPSLVDVLTGGFESPQDIGDNYGQKLSGYLLAPATGDYTFWIASDDSSSLSLSTDESPANKVEIASLDGSADHYQYDRVATQQSSPIHLEAGQRYYIEALMKEFDGLDHVEVQWRLPDGTIENPIPNSRLFLNNMRFLVMTPEEQAKELFLPGFDFEGATLVYDIVTAPAHGAVTNKVAGSTGPRWVYTPTLNYSGTDSFVYRVSDGTNTSTATIYLSVAPVNHPPQISSLANQIMEANTVLGPLNFQIGDVETAAEDLDVSLRLADANAVVFSRLELGGADTNRTLTIMPDLDEIGVTTVILTVFDGTDTTTAQFDLKVVPHPAYSIEMIGTFSGYNHSYSMGINDQGQVVGYSASGSGTKTTRKAFFFNGIQNGGTMTAVGDLGGKDSAAYAINEDGQIVGESKDASGQMRAFLYDNDEMKNLGALLGGTNSYARAINQDGLIAGYATVGGGKRHAFMHDGILRDLGTFSGGQESFATTISPDGVIAGYGDTNGLTRAFIWMNGTMAPVPLPPNTTQNQVWGINSDKHMAGSAWGADNQKAAFVSGPNNSLAMLGFLPGGKFSEAFALNDFGQVVGQAGNSNGNARAFLYSSGILYDLNDLIPERQGTITEARAINQDGAIAGSENANGLSRSILALPAWVIGKRVPRPEGAVARLPEIDILEGNTDDRADNAFYWCAFEKKLYAIRPVMARMRWYISENDYDTNRITVVGRTIWPRRPTVHIANVPVDLEPRTDGFQYAYQDVFYTTATKTLLDPSTKVYQASETNYTVLYYLKTMGSLPNPQTQHPHFEVVRTFTWDDQKVLIDNQPWLIGDTMTNPDHQEYNHKNGYVYFEKSCYDGAGDDRAHDRPSRLGPIIPVNQTAPTANNDMVVIWYHTNQIGVAWACQPIRYSLAWPEGNGNKIIIASAKGSGELDASYYKEIKVYNQPSKDLPGYNPNEEHALLAPSSSGVAIYALRNDLNSFSGASAPYALLKYKDADNQEWHIRAYQVITEEAPYFFRYDGEAGKEIQPPMPVSILQLCQDSYGVSGPYWEDYKGKLYARAAGPEGRHTNLVARYFYPLQPGFYYDTDHDGNDNAAVGDAVPWLDRRPEGQIGVPVDITYNIRWPDATPVLQVGETLFNAKRGLPGVLKMAKAQIIYDDLNPNDDDPIEGLARLYDPLSPRSIKLSDSEKIPDTVTRQSVNGKDVFADLPYYLRIRLSYDSLNRQLAFSGLMDFSGAGQPLLLPNIMTSRERDRILQLAATDLVWQSLISRLYDLTRNPSQKDLDGDGLIDQEVRVGLIMQDGQVVPEQFGDLPKALTAALAGTQPAEPKPGMALDCQGSGAISLPNFGSLHDFTIGCWVKLSAGNSGYLFTNHPAGTAALFLKPEPGANRFLLSDRTTGSQVTEAAASFDDQWHFVCLVREDLQLRLIIDGRQIGADLAADGLTDLSGLRFGVNLAGQVDEIQVWSLARTASEIRAKMNKRLTGNEDGLLLYYRLDDGSGTRVADATGNAFNGTLTGVAWVTSSAPAGIPPRYLTLVENNDAKLGGLPVSLHIIQVDDGPFAGDLKVLYPDNVFDERMTLRLSSDFAGDPDPLQFEWYYKPDSADFDPTVLPTVNNSGLITDSRGWFSFSTKPSDGQGANDVTIGEGGESGLLTLGDNWFICRYRGYQVNTTTDTNWSDWIGDPAASSEARAILVEGWVKRVIRGLNPFDARTKDFHTSEVNTYASMLMQAGARYEGDIAFNPDADNINNVGLVEAYATVLNRGMNLSINGVPSTDYDPANNALLLAAGKIADLYTLLGNEAYADAQDPSIGFGTTAATVGSDIAAVYGSLASSIFCFQNQLSSLLEEELCLLRGRDASAAGVGAPPIYNRLFWNFTLGDGEMAYQQNYNIRDINGDGFIDEKDARLFYPQGHGDAWGHYLTAMSTYYSLLRHPFFTWKPRTESVLVAGTSIEVDFQDERRFARIASQKAKAGQEIVDLSYRYNYVDDATGQWQGYKDTDAERGWGVTEWARRAGQGAYFDWLTGNAILPAVDPNADHTGIEKVDRTTVAELTELTAQFDEIQGAIDKADIGLNPLGLAKGVVPFDIDPQQVALGKTHFEQIQERAVQAVNNALAIWNEANKGTELLRRNQDSVEKFTKSVQDQERDYKNRLIEVFGYPYAGDIGPGLTFPSGYDGPDIYHYMYVNTTEITGETAAPSTKFTNFFKSTRYGVTTQGNTQSGALGEDLQDFYFPTDRMGNPGDRLGSDLLEVEYPYSTADYGFKAPDDWGQRRAPGEVQTALGELLQNQARLKKALLNYDNLMLQIEDSVDLLTARYHLKADELKIKNDLTNIKISMSTLMITGKAISRACASASDMLLKAGEVTIEAFPKTVGLATDAFSAVRSVTKGMIYAGTRGLDAASVAGAIAAEGAAGAIEVAQGVTAVKIEAAEFEYEIQQKFKALEELMRQEAVLRVEVFTQREVMEQSSGHYLAVLSKGQRLLEERFTYRKRCAAETTQSRYQDMTFRVFRNDALQKYRASFDLASRYVFLAATAYDYEVNLLGSDNRAGREFLTDIIRQRSLGQIIEGQPVAGQRGLADPLARLTQNFDVLKTQMGFNNPQTETGRFALRSGLFRVGSGLPDIFKDLLAGNALADVAQLFGLSNPASLTSPASLTNPTSLTNLTDLLGLLNLSSTNLSLTNLLQNVAQNPTLQAALLKQQASDDAWHAVLSRCRVNDLWALPEFRRYCRPFAAESDGPQPGLVLRFITTVTSGLNFFGWPLSGGDSAYDASRFATKIRSVGVWFTGYNSAGLSQTPRIYLVPLGMDVLRAPADNSMGVRTWKIIDQQLPEPFPIGVSAAKDPAWIPINDSLGGTFANIRRFAGLRAYVDPGSFNSLETTSDSRLIGRSVWNTEWMLIIPGATLLSDANVGLDSFIQSVGDIEIFFETYSYSGN